MVEQNKHNIETIATSVATHLGAFVMLTAACVNMAELAELTHLQNTHQLQPAYAIAGQEQTGQGHGEESSRQAKEEIPHGSASFGSSRRSPSVSGSV